MELLSYINRILGEEVLTYDNTFIVCGAGISKDSGLPLGSQIVQRIYEDFDLKDELGKFYKNFNEKIVDEIYKGKTPFFSQPRLEVIFDGIRKVLSPEEYNNYIFDVFFKPIESKQTTGNKTTYSVKPNYHHFLLSEFINKGGTCITFNFDELIETAYKDMYGKKIQVISFPMSSNKIIEKEPVIIKSHGSFSQENNSALNIGIDIQHLHINGFSDEENDYLSKKIKNKNNVIFYGYSISDSLDFIPFMKSVYKGKKINAFFLNYDESSIFPTYKQIKIQKQKTDFFQVDYYLKDFVDNFYYIYYNPDKSFANLINLPQEVSSSIYTIDKSIVESIVFSKKAIIKLSIYKLIGLLNKYGDKELNALSQIKKTDPNYSLYLEFNDYKENIKGLYGSNVKYSLQQFLKKRNLSYLNNLFDKLNEYLFLTPIKSKIFQKIIIAFIIGLIWLILFLIFFFLKKGNPNYTIVKRNLYMPFFRLTRGLKKGSKLSILICKIVLKHILKAKDAAIVQNNMNLYRFIEKERIKMIFAINGKTDELLNQLDELITLNIDTNYFIDIANLLRLKYEITRDDCDKHMCEVFTSITNDNLNKRKIK